VFVHKSKYEALLAEALRLRHDYVGLLQRWNRLVETINSKGGQKFLDHGQVPKEQPELFSKEDLRKLISLCHPDRHGGSKVAVEVTQKLLLLKEQDS
jgi:hypothetical protein